MNKTSNELLVV